MLRRTRRVCVGGMTDNQYFCYSVALSLQALRIILVKSRVTCCPCTTTTGVSRWVLRFLFSDFDSTCTTRTSPCICGHRFCTIRIFLVEKNGRLISSCPSEKLGDHFDGKWVIATLWFSRVTQNLFREYFRGRSRAVTKNR